MGELVPFPVRQSSKFGFQRVRKRRKENPDQLKLFSPELAEIRRLPTYVSPFEEALLFDGHDDRQAEQLYRKAICEGDRVADAYCNLGIIESRAGETAKAFDCFTKSLQNDPRHFESHYNLGNLYFEEDDLRLARMHYELAAELDPASPNLYFNLGLVLALLDEKKAAIDVFLQYRQLAPREECRNADDLIEGLRQSLSASGRKTVS
jgi:tetratricopeptide (TPR) repeat protein